MAAMLMLLVFSQGCKKEYSYERGPEKDSVIVLPPIPKPPSFPSCTACIGRDTSLLSWSFKVDTFLFCGGVTNAIITPDRTAFTFFGPSTCSSDSGLVMTVYSLNTSLDKDKTDITTIRVVFEYYDNITPSDIFLSKPIPGFTFTIEKYNHQSAIATGRFSGMVYTKKDELVYIKEGRFKIKFQ